MRTEIKESCIDHFGRYFSDKIYDNLLENKKESFEEILQDYLENDCFEYEDEHETYETMRDKTEEVEYFLKTFFKIDIN